MLRDAYEVEGLSLHCNLGTKEWERMTKQEVLLDLRFWADASAAGLSDRLKDAVNIADVVKPVRRYVEQSTHQLIESLAMEVLRIMLVDRNLPEAEVTIRKPHAFKNANSEAITMRRTADAFERPRQRGKGR